jgi:hypothetical protein
MKQYKKYLVVPTDQFAPHNFIAVTEELDRINEKSRGISQAFKSEIIISFARDHSLENDWLTANPELAELVISGSLLTGSIEALFESCRPNQAFRAGLEKYLREHLA